MLQAVVLAHNPSVPILLFSLGFRRFTFSLSAVSQRFCLPPTQHYTVRAPKSSLTRILWHRSALLRLILLFHIGQPKAVKARDISITLLFIDALKLASRLTSASTPRPSLCHLSFTPTPRSPALCSPASSHLYSLCR